MPAIVGADGIESDIPIWRQLNYKFYTWKEKKAWK